jgi:excisionase family DNA binding protein
MKYMQETSRLAEALLRGHERMLTVKQVADMCKVSPPTVYRMIKEGTLAATQLGGKTVRIPWTSFLQWLNLSNPGALGTYFYDRSLTGIYFYEYSPNPKLIPATSIRMFESLQAWGTREGLIESAWSQMAEQNSVLEEVRIIAPSDYRVGGRRARYAIAIEEAFRRMREVLEQGFRHGNRPPDRAFSLKVATPIPIFPMNALILETTDGKWYCRALWSQHVYRDKRTPFTLTEAAFGIGIVQSIYDAGLTGPLVESFEDLWDQAEADHRATLADEANPAAKILSWSWPEKRLE